MDDNFIMVLKREAENKEKKTKVITTRDLRICSPIQEPHRIQA